MSGYTSRCLGCYRRWDCVCAAALGQPCPFHALVRERDRLTARWPEWAAGLPGALPVFSNLDKSHPAKAVVDPTIELVAESTGAELVTPSGDRAVGGHTLRVLGAQRLAALGIPIGVIMRRGRWASSAVLGYVKDALLLQRGE